MINDKEGLILYLETEGKGSLTWLDLAKEYRIKEGKSDKKRATCANDIWRQHVSNNPIKGVKQNVSLFEEFLEWKNGKLYKTSVTKPIKDSFDQEGLHLVIGCMHVPFHNEKLFESILKLIQDYKHDLAGFHLIGDFLDLNTLSFHDTGKYPVIKGLTLDKEYELGRKALDKFDTVLSDTTEKSFLYGNHEDRYNRYMSNMQAAKTPISSPTEALQLIERGYHVKENWSQDKFTLGSHLDLMHGTYYNIHTAKKHIDVLRGSVMFAHSHRIQTYIEGDTGGFNIGCAIDLDSPAFNYAARATKSQWQNGFAIVYIDSDGDYHVQQIIVQDGKFVFGGKLYK